MPVTLAPPPAAPHAPRPFNGTGGALAAEAPLAQEAVQGLYAAVFAFNVRREGREYPHEAADSLFDAVAAFGAHRAAFERMYGTDPA